MKCACGKREIQPGEKPGCGCGGQKGHGGCGCGKKAGNDMSEGRPELGLRAAE